MFVKICGITSAEALDAAAAAGADAVGFVFAPSPREISPERAAVLAAALPRGVTRVAVTRHPSADLWRQVCDVFGPDWLQTDAEDLEKLAIPQGVSVLPVFRDGATEPRADAPSRLLFEGAASGNGKTANWDEARGLARRAQLILAGGLNSENVEEAIRHVRPWGVDVSSGVERRRGEKDPAMIREFVARVRAMEGL
jgi:phosphoribosylanthranilate isomerase